MVNYSNIISYSSNHFEIQQEEVLWQDIIHNSEEPELRQQSLEMKIGKIGQRLIYDEKGDVLGSLLSFCTLEKGSCGFHALHGTYDKAKKEYICQEVEQVRTLFSFWIQKGFNENKIPKGIEDELKKDFLSPDTLPDKMKKNKYVKTFLQERKKIEKVPIEKREHKFNELLIRFMKDQEVQKSYLLHIEDVKSYLSPEEMCAAAVWLEKELHLYTACADDALRAPLIYNKGAGVVIRLVLANNHYERALFTSTSNPHLHT